MNQIHNQINTTITQGAYSKIAAVPTHALGGRRHNNSNDDTRITQLLQCAERSTVLSGVISSVEHHEDTDVAVIQYDRETRVQIPLQWMGISVCSSGPEDEVQRLRAMVSAMIGCEVDYVIAKDGVKVVDGHLDTVIGNRALAMQYKRSLYFFGSDAIKSGDTVEATVTAVNQRNGLHVDVCGADVRIPMQDLSYAWVANLRERYHVGDTITVRIDDVTTGDDGKTVTVKASVKDLTLEEVRQQMAEIQVLSQYAGTIVSMANGYCNILLGNGFVVSARANVVYNPVPVTLGARVVVVPTVKKELTCRIYGNIIRVLGAA